MAASTNGKPNYSEKALAVNLTPEIYGSFNEIGAGQEVVSNFFMAGGASGTVAYSQSAYDMKISDSIYGSCERYVCRARLLQMLEREFQVLQEKLAHRAEKTAMFAFADTVEALNFHKTNVGQGWMGIRFQHTPEAEPSDIILHVNMHDNSNQLQQVALGMLGVNLIYGAYFLKQNPEELLISLMDGLDRSRIEIDMISFSGPAFPGVDNRLMALKLVRHSFTDATIFDPIGNVIQPSEYLYKKNTLVFRGRFRPVTLVNVDMLNQALVTFRHEKDVEQDNIAVLFELTLKEFETEGTLNEQDFLNRVDMLSTLGYKVLISNFVKYYAVSEYLSQFAKGKKIGMILGVQRLSTIFDERWYKNLNGGILEAFGKGFGGNFKMYVYPTAGPDGSLFSLEQFQPTPQTSSLFRYMLDNGKIGELESGTPEFLTINSNEIVEMVRLNMPGWEKWVPYGVAEIIENKHLFREHHDLMTHE